MNPTKDNMKSGRRAFSRKSTADTSIDSLAFDDVLYESDDEVGVDLEATLPKEMYQTKEFRDSESEHHVIAATSSLWRRLLPDVLEVTGCIIFYFCTSLFYEHAVDLNYRPMPIESVTTSTGTEFVRNQVFDQIKPDHETAPYAWLRMAAVLGPALQILVGVVVQRSSNRRTTTPWYRHVSATLCTYIVALALTQLVTNSVKKYVGYWRPHFFTGCDPNEDYSACQSLHTSGVRKSFPSSHAATIFTLTMLLTMYLHQTLGVPSIMKRIQVVFDVKDSPVIITTYKCGLWKRYMARAMSICSLLPLAFAVFVASSRVVDNYHHPADVVGGALLGSAVAMFCHGLWFGAQEVAVDQLP